VEHDLKRGKPGCHQHEADEIYGIALGLLPCSLQARRGLHHDVWGGQRGYSGRHANVEKPAPTEKVGYPTPQRRPDTGGEDPPPCRIRRRPSLAWRAETYRPGSLARSDLIRRLQRLGGCEKKSANQGLARSRRGTNSP